MRQDLFTGAGVTFEFDTHLMGVAKQISVLINALHKEMPELNYILRGAFNEAVHTDLAKYGDQPNLHIESCDWRPSLLRKTTTRNVRHIYIYDPSRTAVKSPEQPYGEAPYNTMRLGSPQKEFSVCIEALKFEDRPRLRREHIAKMKQEYGLDRERTIVCGCFPSYDQKLFFEAYRQLPPCSDGRPPSVILIPEWYCVPEKKQRGYFKAEGERIQELAAPYRCRFVTPQHSDATIDADIIVDQRLGVLDQLYALADVAIIGRTFEHGTGSNVLEPAFYGTPIIGGPNCLLNKYAYEGLRESGLLTVAQDVGELRDALSNPFSDTEREKRQKRAAAFIARNQGTAHAFAQYAREELTAELVKKQQRAQRTARA